MSLATSAPAPGPARRYPLANWFTLRQNPLEFLEGLARDYGDVARFRLGPVFVHLINDPELIRSVLVTRAEAYHKGRGLERAKRLLGEGLLTSEDSIHLRQRRLMQPAFHRERISGYGDTMVRYAERAAERWKPGETIDVHREMVGLTLAIVGKTLFDADVEEEADGCRCESRSGETIRPPRPGLPLTGHVHVPSFTWTAPAGHGIIVP